MNGSAAVVPLGRPPEWTREAACVGLLSRHCDPWHPDGKLGAERGRLWAVARRVCQVCPVRLECARHGLALLESSMVYGMFGGLAPAELRHVARQLGRPDRKAAQHGTRSRYVSTANPCRCRDCTRAHAVYEHQRRLRAADGLSVARP